MAALGAALLAACGAAPAAERVVLVTIDTLRADHVGCYGHERARTPTLDGIAAAGARFERAFSPAPLTLPSHATLLTGLDPPHHGARANSVFRLEDDVTTLAERLREAGLATGAAVAAFVLDRQFGLAQGFDHYDDEVAGEPSRDGRVTVGFAERRAGAVVDAALAWLDSAPERFFLWVHLYDPHAAYRPPPGFAAAFPGHPYDGEIAYADAEVGRLLRAVDARWDPDRTLVVVTSDHGESLGEHGEPTHGFTIYEATQRVPLLMRGPGIPAGVAVQGIARLADVAPTVLSAVSAPALDGIDGRDLHPLLRRPRTDGAPAAYMETLAPQVQMGWSPLLGLRTPRFKYIRAPRPELYDLEHDPAELRNLAPERPDEVARLDGLLAEHVADARGTQPTLAVSAEERARLESLGYAVPSAAPERPLGEVGGADPKDMLGLLRALWEADHWLAQGDPARALATLDAAQGEHALTRMVEALAALELGDVPRAERAARRAVALDPENARARLVLARALLAAGKIEPALGALHQAVERDPTLVEAWAEIGRVEEARGHREAAREAYERALEVAPGPAPEVRWRAAALALEQGDARRAERLLADLPEEVRTRPDVALRLAMARLARDPEAGWRELDQLLARAGAPEERARIHRARGAALEEAGRLEDALAEREAALELTPGDPAAANDLAWSLARLGRDLGRAEILARRAVDAQPAPAFLDTLATVQSARGHWPGVLATTERALAQPGAPSTVRAHLHYLRARALAELGRPGESREAARAALAELGEQAPPWRADVERLAAAKAPPE